MNHNPAVVLPGRERTITPEADDGWKRSPRRQRDRQLLPRQEGPHSCLRRPDGIYAAFTGSDRDVHTLSDANFLFAGAGEKNLVVSPPCSYDTILRNHETAAIHRARIEGPTACAELLRARERLPTL